jgi:hypothetical protein
LVALCSLASITHASVNVPLHHWSYEAIERLTALGVIDRAMLRTKPYSRTEAALYVSRGIERIRTDRVPGDLGNGVADQLITRLATEFRKELIDLGTLEGDKRRSATSIRYGGRATTEIDMFSVGGGQTVRLRENRGGEYYANGVQNQTDVRGWLEIGEWGALMAQPKFISNRHALGIGATNNSYNFYLREFSAKLTAFNVSLEAGRGTLWWGQGYHGSLLLTDHAFPLEMVKLGSEAPFRLPWILKDLGEWKINTFLARLEKDRDYPRAKVFGARLSYLPASWFELGLTRLTQYGDASQNQSFPKTVYDAWTNTPNQEGALNVNEQSMVDFRLKAPYVPYLVPFVGGLQVYGEIASEDKWSKYPLPSRAAILGGIYVPQLFDGDSQDLRIEYADTDLTRRKAGISNFWYNHHRFTSGMRHRGFPLGHHMGADGIDIFMRTTRYLTDDIQLGLNVNFQDRFRGMPVYEEKKEVGLDASWWLAKGAQVTASYTYQSIKNPGQITAINPFSETSTPNLTATNHLLSTALAVDF